MSHEISAVVPVVYVSDLGRAEGFYELLGLATQARGNDGAWSWVYLRAGEMSVLLAAGGTPVPGDPGPALLHVSVSDLGSVTDALAAAGHSAEHLGFPDHAPGGEARATDPDGHGIILAQPTGVPGGRPGGHGGRRSTLQAAADAVQRRGVAEQRCQIGLLGGGACERPAAVKLADSWGDTAWSCVEHADEVLVNAPGAYIATEDGQGLAQYLRIRHRSRPPAQ